MIRKAARVSAELAGFAILLFVTRFVMRSHLIPLMDQECHIGGIAVDVLAHGVRFPLLTYAPNEYDNGSFFSGLLAAASFALLGRSVLALKLVTHLISAAGAVAALWLLRGCLDELGITSRRTRWAATAALVVGIAFAPRIETSPAGSGFHGFARRSIGRSTSSFMAPMASCPQSMAKSILSSSPRGGHPDRAITANTIVASSTTRTGARCGRSR